MEMVIDGMRNKQEICGDPNAPKDIEEWKGVGIEDGEVVEIEWGNSSLTGSLCLAWLPFSVRKFVVTSNRLTGTLDWASLPTSLKKLNIGANSFTADPMEGHLFVVGWTSTPS
ncbi:hypothetical protein XU18_2357 [Perkinsela sp. CCAP 1560/4]|nr:hypothetical protein XU18_2357 [Perkinsela sp. CCAP 1560/4]|eukprot:KNH06884.1 hypothetical protein XU18_2357 [Perkinsela sp. CCAP 1560/4]